MKNWTLFIVGNIICPVIVDILLHYSIKYLDNKKK